RPRPRRSRRWPRQRSKQPRPPPRPPWPPPPSTRPRPPRAPEPRAPSPRLPPPRPPRPAAPATRRHPPRRPPPPPPWQRPPPPQPVHDRDRPRSSGFPWAIAAAALVVAAVVGFLAGKPGSDPKKPARASDALASSASAGPLGLHFPASWERRSNAPAIPGL